MEKPEIPVLRGGIKVEPFQLHEQMKKKMKIELRWLQNDESTYIPSIQFVSEHTKREE